MNLSAEFEKAGTTEGVYHLSGGENGYTYAIKKDDGTYAVRYESGWYCTYNNDGIRPVAGIIRSPDGTVTEVPGGDKRNIVMFEPLSMSDARKKYPDINLGFRP
jgi:hypothetical protein